MRRRRLYAVRCTENSGANRSYFSCARNPAFRLPFSRCPALSAPPAKCRRPPGNRLSTALCASRLRRACSWWISQAAVCWRRMTSRSGAHAAAPGSTLKPLVLYALVGAGRWNPASRVACNRQLVSPAVASRAPTRPRRPSMHRRRSHGRVTATSPPWRAACSPVNWAVFCAPPDCWAHRPCASGGCCRISRAQSADSEELALLGVDGVRVTPLELAAAYRWLALSLLRTPIPRRRRLCAQD